MVSHSDHIIDGLPEVTIVILSHNRCQELKIVLDKIQSLEYPSHLIKIIVVDNASRDGTPGYLQSRSEIQTVFLSRNVGISGWNEGLTSDRSEFFLLLDDDCYLEGNALRVAVQASREENADLVSFLVRSPQWPAFVFNQLYNTGLLSFWGCAALISRKAISRLGGFDRYIFIWAHEVEFTLRFLDQGFRHLYLPQVSAWHMNTPGYSDYKYVLNNQNLAYIAGARFPYPFRRNAMIALMIPVLDGIGRQPHKSIYWRVIGSMITGFRMGRRHFAPVDKEIAEVYTDFFPEYSLSFRLTPVAWTLCSKRKTYFPGCKERATLSFPRRGEQ